VLVPSSGAAVDDTKQPGSAWGEDPAAGPWTRQCQWYQSVRSGCAEYPVTPEAGVPTFLVSIPIRVGYLGSRRLGMVTIGALLRNASGGVSLLHGLDHSTLHWWLRLPSLRCHGRFAGFHLKQFRGMFLPQALLFDCARIDKRCRGHASVTPRVDMSTGLPQCWPECN